MENMKKEISARFIISADNGKVQGVGYRLFIIQKFKGYGLLGSIPENIPHDGVRVTVKGDKEIIESFYEELKEETPEGENVGTIKLSELEHGDFEVKNFTQEEFQFLLYGQLSNGISAILSMNKTVDTLDKKYGRIFSMMSVHSIMFLLILLVLFILASGFGFI